MMEFPLGYELTTRQISEQMEKIYEFEYSKGFIFGVTDKILPDINDWQNGPLDGIDPVLFGALFRKGRKPD